MTFPAYADMPAFPGATGYGQNANSWRGGEIIHVTNMNDTGEGSLRECAQGGDTPRVCVFDTSGTIVVDTPIRVSSNVYIAGQTAPGDGVQIKLGKSQQTPLVVQEADGVLIRYLKVRPGASTEPSSNVDGITIIDSQNVYLDHLSLQFATDENLGVHTDTRPVRDITVANSILAWGLDRANHPSGHHSKGALICSARLKDRMDCGRISLVRNLFANNRDRNPDIKGSDTGPVEVVNNVFFNPISQFGEFYNILGNTRVDYVGNVAMAGPSTRKKPRPPAVGIFAKSPDYTIEVYVRDNVNVETRDCESWDTLPVVDPDAADFVTEAEPELAVEEILPSKEVYRAVMQTVGARRGDFESADALDRKLIGETWDCEGSVINATADVGGWPDIEVLAGPEDSDRDGMPDKWEADNGLDAQDAADAWTDVDGDGWSNLEQYLNARAAAL